MAKQRNPTDSDSVRITLSAESVRLLKELAARGVFGRNHAEVAARFVDKALQDFFDKPNLALRKTGTGAARRPR